MNNFAQNQLRKMHRAMLLAFFAVALSLIFWTVVRSNNILARDDNPRLVEAELRIQRGRILDRNGSVLAETVGEPDALVRNYPFPTIGPAVGYYSFRHGTAGAEAGLDAVLRGEDDSMTAVLNRELLHLPLIGRDVQLTIDAHLQTNAEALFGAAQGGLVLLEIETGNILAMVSHPGYNPNLLDENFNDLADDETAPLLNRAVQGQYQPGLVLQPFILAAALDADRIQLDGTVLNPNRPVSVNDQIKQCQTTPPNDATWADVLRHHCPAPMQELADRLGLANLEAIFLRFGLTAPPDLPLNLELPETEPLSDAMLTGIGQDTMTVSPLQLALALATLGNNGRLPTPRLVTAVEDESGILQPEPDTTTTEAVTGLTARTISQLLNDNADTLSFSVQALSGPTSRNGWYLALIPAAQPQYALVIVVENSENLDSVTEMGAAVETAVLSQ